MFIFWFFTLYTVMLLNGKYFDNGAVAALVIAACFWDMILYSLASQWVKRPNVSRPIITKTNSIDPGIYKDSDAYKRLIKDLEKTIKGE